MAEFLTENAVFICDKGSVITCKDSGNNSVKYNGATLLTTGATVNTKAGVCVTLSAPCNCQLSAWIPGFSPMKISNGKPLLIDTAKNFCTVGAGNISVKVSGVFGKLTTGNAPASMSITALNLNNPADSKQNVSAEKNSTAKNSAEKNFTEKNSAEKVPAENSKKLLSKPSKNLFCPYNENDAKCQNCEYPRTPTTIDNNSAKLRENYLAHIADENNRDEVDKHFLKVQDKFKFQAHHLISGNQIFAPIKKAKDGRKINRRAKLVRLANFCGYDINNAKNCIMLVMYGENYGEQAGGKSGGAYDTMSLSKIQWHVGGHSYKFSPEETKKIQAQIRFYTKKNSAEPILNYVQAVSAELDKIQAELATSIVCRNSPKQKNSLIARLNKLSAEIKKKLGAFTEKPQKSFPFYVSKEAYTYAFNLPQTAKIILIRRAGEKFLFEKFRAERFSEVLTSDSGKKLIFNPKGAESFKLDTRENAIDCIAFCENIEYFILADGVDLTDIFFLPTNEKFTKIISGKIESGLKFLEQHDTEILVWLKDMQGEYQYTAIKQKIDERKNALGAET